MATVCGRLWFSDNDPLKLSLPSFCFLSRTPIYALLPTTPNKDSQWEQVPLFHTMLRFSVFASFVLITEQRSSVICPRVLKAVKLLIVVSESAGMKFHGLQYEHPFELKTLQQNKTVYHQTAFSDKVTKLEWKQPSDSNHQRVARFDLCIGHSFQIEP